MCDSVTPWEHGSVLRTPSCPSFWDANTVRVETAGVDAATMHAAADAALADCPHRKLDVDDEATGEAARPFFAARGWMNERLAMMRRTGPPPPVLHDVEEVPLAETRALRTEWYSSELGDDEGFAAAQDPILARRGMRAFVVRGAAPRTAPTSGGSPPRGGAAPVGFAMLAVGADAAEIDGLYVTPSARGRGIGASLVAAALAAGGRDVAWIVADDEGQARALYERLGFATVWRPYNFVRTPS